MSPDIPTASTTVASDEAKRVLVHDDAEQRHADARRRAGRAVIAFALPQRCHDRARPHRQRARTPRRRARAGARRSTIDSCCTSCRYCGSRNSMPVKTKYATNSVTEPADDRARRRMRTSNSGASERAAPARTNAADQTESGDELPSTSGSSPAPVRALDHAEQEHAEAERPRAARRPRRGGARPACATRGSPGARRTTPSGDDRHVDQEDRAPPEVVEQDPAHHGSDGEAGGAEDRQRGDGRRPLLRRVEHGDDRERGATTPAAPTPMSARARDQRFGRVAERREQAREAEQRVAGEEHDLAAVAVGQPAAEHEQPGEHDVVGVDHPLQVAGRRVELAADERQRDVRDRDVEAGRQRAEAQHGERRLPRATDPTALVVFTAPSRRRP